MTTRFAMSGAVANATRAMSIRAWWNTCLRASSQPSCRCLHSMSRTSAHTTVVLPADLRSSLFPTSVRSHPHLPGRRPLSSAALEPSTVQTSPPSFSSASASPTSSASSSLSAPPLSDAVQLTDAAAARIGKLRAKHGPGMRLRLSVDSGGCSGLSYKFEIDQHGKQSDDWSAHTPQRHWTPLSADRCPPPLHTAPFHRQYRRFLTLFVAFCVAAGCCGVSVSSVTVRAQCWWTRCRCLC